VVIGEKRSRPVVSNPIVLKSPFFKIELARFSHLGQPGQQIELPKRGICGSTSRRHIFLRSRVDKKIKLEFFIEARC
jgi:hypothetical protein